MASRVEGGGGLVLAVQQQSVSAHDHRRRDPGDFRGLRQQCGQLCHADLRGRCSGSPMPPAPQGDVALPLASPGY